MVNEEGSVSIPVDSVRLSGDLTLPPKAEGIVLFAHGSGSSRHSRRNRHVAKVLNDAGLATLLFDLLTETEDAIDEATSEFRFDIPLLATQLIGATRWCLKQPTIQPLKVGYFGASTGAAAALIAASELPDVVCAVVSRGGRPDLAGRALEKTWAPTLLIVGGYDNVVIDLNEEAYRQLAATEKRLEIIPHATHLFEEPGALDKVAELARSWFKFHLTALKEPNRAYG